MKRISLLAVALGLSACMPYQPSGRYDFVPQQVVVNLDPARLVGTWYEIASFPAPFQKGCYAATAEYTLQPNGTLAVVNRCRVAADPSQVREISGTVRPVNGGALKVDLGSIPFAGNFWVLDISPDGRTLVVGAPERMTGWLLSRDNRYDPVQMDRAKAVFERSGYDINSLQRTKLAH